MNNQEEEFLKRLRAMFRVEAEEHIKALSSGLIELEKNPKNNKSIELIETIFRAAHSLKGAARSVNRIDIESICHVLESVFSNLKNEQLSLEITQFDLVHKAIDTISKMLPATGTIDNRELIKQLQSIIEEDQTGKIKEEMPNSIKSSSEKDVKVVEPINILVTKDDSYETKSLQSETVRIPTAKLDPLFLQAEQMIQSKAAFIQRIIDLKNIYNFIGTWKSEFGKRDTHSTADKGVRSKELANWTNEKLSEIERTISAVIYAIESDQRLLGRMIDDHVESMKNVLMLPLSVIVEGFPILVRDLARSQNKEIELLIHGKDIEVDKRILDELKDPLIHLIRNCIDHGINNPEKQLKIKKKEHGTITLTFLVIDGHNLEISISDNGAGINVDKVISAAIKAGIISPDAVEKLSLPESLDLIFKSGISTSPMITDISGRGLGLAIVREKIEKLGGRVSVETKSNIGTTFRLFLPLKLSTSRGVLVRTGEHFFFIPTVNVKRVIKIRKDEIKSVENRETFHLDQEIIWAIRLGDALGLNDKTMVLSAQNGNTVLSSNFIQIIVLTKSDKRFGFIVDEIFEEHQVLEKNLGRQLNRVKNISGAAVLGTGKVVPVINVSDLMQSAIQLNASRKGAKEKEIKIIKKYKILVIDDSITSRTLIKNIVESAGYLVETAVDGVDAFTKALVGEFDLIVSDVDMPRMNGFELTAKIRKEKKLGELPVVLVTALESREDREHGIDVGANAYIVKSSFDQSNLLEVIKKLL